MDTLEQALKGPALEYINEKLYFVKSFL